MRVAAALACLMVALLALAGAAAAAPVLYFMKDTADGPAVDGVLDWQPPPPADLQNPQNNTPPGARVLVPMLPTSFAAPDGANNTGRIRGPVIIGLWAPDTQTVREGTILVELVEFPPAQQTPIRLEGTVLASQTIPLTPTNVTPPDPAVLVPPDPTDPEGAAAHIATQALVYGLPMLLQPPYVLVFTGENNTVFDVAVEPDAAIGIRLTLMPAALPVPLAVGQAIEYDFGLSPSFVFVPWYEEKPATTTTTSRTSSPPSTTGARPTTLGPGTDDPREEDAPGIAWTVPTVALVAAVAFLRRRT